MTTRNRALDGIRGLALIAVLAYHVGPGVFRGGFLGVEIFFVLSGFLLTSLLLAERERAGHIDHVRYAIRRVRRLVPAGLALLAGILLVAPVVAPEDVHRLRGDLLSSLAAVTNWRLIADGSSYFAVAGRPPFVRHLWSLAVEIQFCVVCSLAAAWLAKREKWIAVRISFVAMAASALAMTLLYRSPDPSRAYYGTDTRFGALASGVMLAVVLSGGVADRIADAARRVVVPAAAALGALVIVADQTARWMYPAGFLVTQAATIVLIVAAISDRRSREVLGTSALRWLGERSYGIYLWHWPLVVLLRPGIDVTWHPIVTAAVTIGVATALGTLSFRLVERPIIGAPRVREVWSRLAGSEARLAAGAAAITTIAAFAGLAVRLPTNDPIADSISAGESFIAARLGVASELPPEATARVQAAVLGAQPASARQPAPGPLPAPQAHLSTFVPGSTSVSAIGDSVMVGGAKSLSEKLGASGYIDAAKNRRFSEAATIARNIREQGRLGRVVIVHLGNNGPVTDGEIEDFLHQVKGVQSVLLVTVRVNRAWQGSVNDTLRAGAARHRSTIKLVDWHAHSEGHPEWFYSDGTHLRSAGAEQYAKLLTGSIPPPPTPKPTPKPTPTPTPTPAPLPLPSLVPPGR